MLSELKKILQGDMMGLLAQPHVWNTLEVLYETPRVERLWMQWDENRLYVHRIHPCNKPFFHPHPWPSAIYVVSGRYRMRIGSGKPDGAPPTLAATLLVNDGSAYEMVDPEGWHSVEPVGGPSVSFMLTGKPWAKSPVSAEQRAANPPLSDQVKIDILRHAENNLGRHFEELQYL